MTGAIKIRAYSIQDKPKLIQILKLNVPESFDETEIEDFENYLDKELEIYFVAELDGEIVGCGGINFEDKQKIGKISWDFINPKFQKIGVGKKLLQHRLDILHSMKSIEIISVRTSQIAYKFYEKNGFVLEEIYKDYWAKGFDMYKMIYQKNNYSKNDF